MDRPEVTPKEGEYTSSNPFHSSTITELVGTHSKSPQFEETPKHKSAINGVQRSVDEMYFRLDMEQFRRQSELFFEMQHRTRGYVTPERLDVTETDAFGAAPISHSMQRHLAERYIRLDAERALSAAQRRPITGVTTDSRDYDQKDKMRIEAENPLYFHDRESAAPPVSQLTPTYQSPNYREIRRQRGQNPKDDVSSETPQISTSRRYYTEYRPSPTVDKEIKTHLTTNKSTHGQADAGYSGLQSPTTKTKSVRWNSSFEADESATDTENRRPRSECRHSSTSGSERKSSPSNITKSLYPTSKDSSSISASNTDTDGHKAHHKETQKSRDDDKPRRISGYAVRPLKTTQINSSGSSARKTKHNGRANNGNVPRIATGSMTAIQMTKIPTVAVTGNHVRHIQAKYQT
jgi:hypothetical protein